MSGFASRCGVRRSAFAYGENDDGMNNDGMNNDGTNGVWAAEYG